MSISNIIWSESSSISKFSKKWSLKSITFPLYICVYNPYGIDRPLIIWALRGLRNNIKTVPSSSHAGIISHASFTLESTLSKSKICIYRSYSMIDFIKIIKMTWNYFGIQRRRYLYTPVHHGVHISVKKERKKERLGKPTVN